MISRYLGTMLKFLWIKVSGFSNFRVPGTKVFKFLEIKITGSSRNQVFRVFEVSGFRISEF
jgi:hypothetical protein